VNDVLDGPDITGAEQAISDALDALGIDSDAVERRLADLGYLAVTGSGSYAVCEYLQDEVDAAAEEVTIDFCDTLSVDFAVVNPDGETWTQANLSLPWPVLIFCCSGERPR
jgi:hypothetical protein